VIDWKQSIQFVEIEWGFAVSRVSLTSAMLAAFGEQFLDSV
jgi:hypothetical protein